MFLIIYLDNIPRSSSGGRVKGALVNKSIEILGLELTFSMFRPDHNFTCLDDVGVSGPRSSNDGEKFNHVLAPFNLSGALVV